MIATSAEEEDGAYTIVFLIYFVLAKITDSTFSALLNKKKIQHTNFKKRKKTNK
jgi:hypothetical protein